MRNLSGCPLQQLRENTMRQARWRASIQPPLQPDTGAFVEGKISSTKRACIGPFHGRVPWRDDLYAAAITILRRAMGMVRRAIPLKSKLIPTSVPRTQKELDGQ